MYFDNNGTTTGSGVINGATINVNAGTLSFNTVSTGLAGTLQDTTAADDLVFSAGTDAGAVYTLDLKNYSFLARSLTFEEGAVTLARTSGARNKTNVTIGAGGITANQNAIFDVATVLSAAQTWTIAAGKSITLTAAEGTLNNGGFGLSIAGAGDAVFAGIISGAGALNLIGTGNTAINNTGNLLTGLTSVNTGATLAGTGNVNAINLNSGGFIAPGAIGSTTASTFTATGLTWNGGGSMKFHLGTANTSDRLALGTGALTKGTAGAYLFDFQNTGTVGNTYTLISGTALGATFNATNFSYTNLAAGLAGTFAYNAASGVTFTTTAIPEGEFALGAGVMAAVAVGIRRRKRTAPSA